MAEGLTKTREKNLRHGIKMWGEVPTSGDVEALFVTIDNLRDSLLAVACGDACDTSCRCYQEGAEDAIQPEGSRA